MMWVVFAVIAWIIAARKGRSGFPYFVASFCLTPLVGLTAAVLAKRKEESAQSETTDSSLPSE